MVSSGGTLVSTLGAIDLGVPVGDGRRAVSHRRSEAGLRNRTRWSRGARDRFGGAGGGAASAWSSSVGGVGVAVSAPEAQMVRPSFISQPCVSSASSMAVFSLSKRGQSRSTRCRPRRPPRRARSTTPRPNTGARAEAIRRRVGSAVDGAMHDSSAGRLQNGVAVISTLRKRLSRVGSPANSSASARTAASRRWWNSGSRAGSMLR